MDRQHKITHRKMMAINSIIAAGCLAILAVTVMHGSPSYQNADNLINTVFLTVITAGIPMVLFAAVAFLGLSFLLFQPGEREAYEAQKAFAALRQAGSRPALRLHEGPETKSAQLLPDHDKHVD